MWGMSGIASYVKAQGRPEYNNDKQVCEEADYSGSDNITTDIPPERHARLDRASSSGFFQKPRVKAVSWGGSISAPALDGESFVSSVIIGGIQGIINIMPYKCGFGSEALLDNNRADSTEYDVQKYDVQNFDAEDATPPDIDAFPVDASDTFDIPETLVPDTFDVPDTIVPIDVPLEDIDVFTPDVPVEVEEEIDTEDVDAVNVCGNPPSVFGLTSPADKAVKVPASQTFSWEQSTDPDSEDVVTYCLKVAKNPALETPIVDECGIEETNFTPAEGVLEHGEIYFWNVEAQDSCSTTTYSSETRSFTIAPAPGPCDNPPGKSNLLFPEDKQTNIYSVPMFSWQASTDPDAGDSVTACLQVDDNSDFSSPEIDQCIDGGIDYMPKAGVLKNGTSYFVKVTAKDTCQPVPNQTPSDITTFATAGPCDNSPSKSSIISPKDNETKVSPTATVSWQAPTDTDPGDAVISCLQIDDNSDFSSPAITGCVVATDFTLPAEALAFGTKYYAQVTTKDMCLPEPNQTPSDISTFSTVGPCDNIPSVFGLSSPIDMATNVPLTPTLSWEASSDVDPGLGFTPVDAVNYTVVVADNIGFENPIINQSDIKDTNYTVKASLLPNNTYYWKVFANDSCETQNIIPSADIRSFTTAGPCDNAPSTSPEVILPQNKANWVPLMPTIVWKQTQDMDPADNVTYDLLVAEDPNFNSPVIDVKGLIFPQYTPEKELSYNTKYYVKVSAQDSCSPIPGQVESQVASFTTEKLCLPQTLGESDLTSGDAYDLDLESNPGSLMLKRTWTAGWSANSGVLPSEATPAWTYSGQPGASSPILETDPVTGEKAVHMKSTSNDGGSDSYYYTPYNSPSTPGLINETGWVVQIRGRRGNNSENLYFTSGMQVSDNLLFSSILLMSKSIIIDDYFQQASLSPSAPFTTMDISHTYRLEGKGNTFRVLADEKLLLEGTNDTSWTTTAPRLTFNDFSWGYPHESDNYWNHIQYYTGGDKVPFNPAAGKYYRMIDFGADQNNIGSGATLSSVSTVPNGTSLVVETRTGSVEIPDASWSPWTALSGEAIASPAARYLQLRYDFNANEDKTESPKLDEYKIDYCTY